jgi:MFS family permease
MATLRRTSDIFGRVRLYSLGFAIFAVGSLLPFLAPGPFLDGLRVVCGVLPRGSHVRVMVGESVFRNEIGACPWPRPLRCS